MSEANVAANSPEVKESPELEKLKHSHRIYSNTLSIIANAEFDGWQAEAVLEALQFHKKIQTELEAQIKILEPEKPKEAPQAEAKEASAAFKEAVAAA